MLVKDTPRVGHWALFSNPAQPNAKILNPTPNSSPAFGIYKVRELASAARYKTCLM